MNDPMWFAEKLLIEVYQPIGAIPTPPCTVTANPSSAHRAHTGS
jgi:hypothetical protein